MNDSYEELVEKAVSYTTNIEDFQNIQVGQGGSYEHALFTKDGDKVAVTTGGFKVMLQRDDKQFVAYLTNEITFEDGSGAVRVAAWIDLGSLFSGDWVYYPYTGISGRYLGKTGFMAWHPHGIGTKDTADVKLITFASPE